MEYHLQRGQLLLRQQRYTEAEKEFKQALSKHPDNPYAMAFLAECYLETSRYPEALQLAESAVGIDPEIPFLYYSLARAYLYNKKTDKAREAIKEGLYLRPGDADFFLLLSNVEFYEENWKAALEATEQGLELDPENVHLVNMRAQCLVKLNRQEEASETLDFALNRAPENSYSHANKGWVAIEKDQYDEAIKHFKEALRLDPTNEYAQSGLKESIKAKNILYRYILKYFLWISKMNERGRWLFIIGIYVLYRVILNLARNNPSLAPLLYPLVVAYIIFAFSSWIAVPVSNLFLRFHPLGKYALTEDEILGSNIVGLLGAGAILSLLTFYFTDISILLLLGAYMGIMLIPVGGLFGVDATGKARRYLTLYTLALAGAGALAIFVPGMGTAAIVFLIGVFAYGWVANYLIQKDAKEFR